MLRAQDVGEIGEEARDFQTFINPEGEDDEPEEQEVELQDIIDHYTEKVGLEVPPKEAAKPLALLSLAQATQALATLQSYFEAQQDSTINDMKLLNTIDKQLTYRGISERKQSSITAYFKAPAAQKDS